jgi:hypothetical protein
MTSQIGWIVFSPKDRDRVKRFLDLMGMGGVVDELGIGMIRDAMSNRLFPGFSTLYTRAKYFFITPYIILDKDANQKKNQTGKDYFQNAEVQVNRLVIQFYDNHQERAAESYFGKDKRDGNLKRQPSEIYWNGIRELHLVETESSIDQLLSDKRSLMDELLSKNRGDDTTREQGENTQTGCVNVSYDPHWQEYIKENGLMLTRTEAETLCDRLCKYTPNSLPAALVSDEDLFKLYASACQKSKNSDYIDNPFVHFVVTSISRIKNNELHDNLVAAHDMALFLHGAHIAYNIQLWSKTHAEEDFINQKRKEGRLWLGTLASRMLNFKGFNIVDCFERTNLKQPTRHFLVEMQRLVRTTNDWDEIENDLCKLAEMQERWNKKAKSRFVKMEKGQVIEEIGKPQWLGLSLISYRYQATLTILNDIYQGLKATEE